MNVLKGFAEKILYEHLIPVMFVTQKDMQLFQEDPIEYIRKQFDFTSTLFTPKNAGSDLLTFLTDYKETKK